MEKHRSPTFLYKEQNVHLETDDRFSGLIFKPKKQIDH